MSDTENHNCYPRSIRRAAISRADLLRAWYLDDFTVAIWLAEKLEFDFVVETKPAACVPFAEHDRSFQLSATPSPSPETGFATPPLPEPISAFWLPTRYFLGERPAMAPSPSVTTLPAKLEWTNRPVPLQPIGLATWPEVRTRLSPIFEPTRRSPKIDIDKVVDLLSRGRQFVTLPTGTHFRLERPVCVIEDRSARLIPYHQDQRWMIGLLETHLPKGYFAQLSCNSPRRIVNPNRSAKDAIRSSESHEPAAGCHVLVLSDLGLLGPSVRLQSSWYEWIQERRRRDCQISVMVPFPIDHVPDGFREISEFYSWQNASVKSVRDRQRRDDLVHEILKRLSPASSFDPVLLRWIRQTVPEASDASLESFVWQDLSLDSNQYASAKNDRTESKKELRSAFHALPGQTKQMVLQLLRHSRAGIDGDPSLWFVELLSLQPEEWASLENSASDLEDAKRAICFLDAKREDHLIGRSVKEFLKWFTERVELDGVWAGEQGIRETIRRWQREFHADREWDPHTRIGEAIERDGIHARQSVWLKASSTGLSIQKYHLDQLCAGNAVALETSSRILEVHGTTDRDCRFWRSKRKPEWVSDYGTDRYGAWCEFQVPRHDHKGVVTQLMRWIPPGEFMMGSPESEKGRWYDEGPQHPVKLTIGYWLADKPVTQELWMAINQGENPSKFKGESRPVERVSWDECQAWLGRLRKQQESLHVSLPTEAQWEYACRAGSTTAYCFGDDPKELTKYAWFADNSQGSTHPVKQLLPNAWGLHDLHGNVWEWCSDCFGTYPSTFETDPAGPGQGARRVFRGGRWNGPARNIRSAYRHAYHPAYRDAGLGFRFLRSAIGAEPTEEATTPSVLPSEERPSKGAALEYSFLRSLDLNYLSSNKLEDGFTEFDYESMQSVRVISDFASYQFDRMIRPDWAVEFGCDAYGLYASFEVQRDATRTAKTSLPKNHTKESSHVATAIRQRMRWIPPGRFLMGSPTGEQGRSKGELQHPVNITHGYWLFDTPCTQAMWECVMGENPSEFKDPERPVENVSWDGVAGFVSRLHDRLPSYLRFRLPTEAEWEYACRAGTTTATYAGDLEVLGDANAPLLDGIAWYVGNSAHEYDLSKSFSLTWLKERQYPETHGGTRKVGKKAPNGRGLYDMLGNVWEWCLDWYQQDLPVEQTNPTGPTNGSRRVIRGGSWINPIVYLVRSAYRSERLPNSGYYDVGFRLLCSAFEPRTVGESREA